MIRLQAIRYRMIAREAGLDFLLYDCGMVPIRSRNLMTCL